MIEFFITGFRVSLCHTIGLLFVLFNLILDITFCSTHLFLVKYVLV